MAQWTKVIFLLGKVNFLVGKVILLVGTVIFLPGKVMGGTPGPEARGLRFKLKTRLQGLELRVQVEAKVQGLELRVRGLGPRFRVEHSGFRV